MHQTTELTVVLKAREGEHIGDLAPFLKAGSTVAVGRSGAVVSSVSAGDKIAHAEQLESQVVIAEAAMRRGVQLPDDCAVVSQPQFNLDDHVRMVADARRYRWLRNVAFDTPRQDMALRDKSANMLIEQDLDIEIDCAMHAYPGSVDQDEEWGEIPDETFAAMKTIADRHPVEVTLEADPRDLFIAANPIGASSDELEKGRNGFVDERTHADYLIFLAGYRAALETPQ